MPDIDIDDLSWVKRGKQRREIIVRIEGIKTPSEIARDADYSLNNTSRVLNDFRRRDLVTLHNPEEKTGRLYELSEKGKTIRDELRTSTE